MFAPLKHRQFALLWLGGVVSMMGDWMMFAALPYFVYERTGAPLAAGALFGVMTLPWVLFGSISGVFADRWDRRRSMIACDLVRAGVVCTLVLLSFQNWIWLVYVVAFLEQTASTLFGPAQNALIPVIVPEGERIAANSLSSVSANLARVVGPSVGGAILGLAGLPVIVFVDTGSYVFSAAMILAMGAVRAAPVASPATEGEAAAEPSAQPGARESEARLLAGIWRDWAQGLALVRRSRLLTGLFIAVGVAVFGDSALTGVAVPFSRDVLHLSSAEFGWLLSGRGIGGLAGAFVAAQAGRYLGAERLFTLSLACIGVLFALFANIRPFGAELALIALMGLPAAGWAVAETTLLQNHVADAFRGRVFGTYFTTASLLSLLGIGFAGALAGPTGSATVVNAAALLYFTAAVLAALFVLARPVSSSIAPSDRTVPSVD